MSESGGVGYRNHWTHGIPKTCWNKIELGLKCIEEFRIITLWAGRKAATELGIGWWTGLADSPPSDHLVS